MGFSEIAVDKSKPSNEIKGSLRKKNSPLPPGPKHRRSRGWVHFTESWELTGAQLGLLANYYMTFQLLKNVSGMRVYVLNGIRIWRYGCIKISAGPKEMMLGTCQQLSSKSAQSCLKSDYCLAHGCCPGVLAGSLNQ